MENCCSWFDDMIEHCYDYAVNAKKSGKKVVGIMCEYTPRELIMAADAVPVCLCGGSHEMIATAEADLPANLCPLIKSTYGYHLQKENPFLEMADLFVAETTCDGKKKMFELMAETRDIYVLELPQKADDADAFEHWVLELHKLRAVLEEKLERKITDDDIWKAIDLMNHERFLRLMLAESMKSELPPLTGKELLNLKSIISGIPEDLEQYQKIMIELANKPRVPERIFDVRVMLTGVPVVHGAEKVVDIIESSNGLIVCAENCTGVKPILQNVDTNESDPIRALARKYFDLPCSVMTPNEKRLEVLAQLAEEYKPECVVELIWHACLTYDVESYKVKKFTQEVLGIPYLRIETDYSPSDIASIKVRVEALMETVKELRPEQCECHQN